MDRPEGAVYRGCISPRTDRHSEKQVLKSEYNSDFNPD
ncbi:hypothetical protein HMPREF0378_1532 [Eubacterium nodatum ATCC 33099]|nr:hypothetical protein HMPREF0378_1532 [Eubacterium nodatum ATCC 33099]